MFRQEDRVNLPLVSLVKLVQEHEGEKQSLLGGRGGNHRRSEEEEEAHFDQKEAEEFPIFPVDQRLLIAAAAAAALKAEGGT
jgi:hypothetical protein